MKELGHRVILALDQKLIVWSHMINFGRVLKSGNYLLAARVLPVEKYLGWRVTAYGIVLHRLKDSFGLGVSIAGLNKNTNPRAYEFIL